MSTFKSRRSPSWLTSKSLPLPRAKRSVIGAPATVWTVRTGPLAPCGMASRTHSTLVIAARGQVGLYDRGTWVAA